MECEEELQFQEQLLYKSDGTLSQKNLKHGKLIEPTIAPLAGLKATLILPPSSSVLSDTTHTQLALLLHGRLTCWHDLSPQP